MSLPLVTAMVGDRWSGKSALYVTYSTKHFPEAHVTAAEVEDCDPVTFVVGNGRRVPLELFEVAGDMYDFNEIRHFNYRRANIVLLCFSVVRPASLTNVLKRWGPEVKQYCRKGTLVLLVGTQVDLRTDQETLTKMAAKNETPVSYEQGRMMARKVKAMKYMECSAKTRVGLDELFAELERLAQLLEKRANRDMCVVS